MELKMIDGSTASWTKQDGERWQDYWLDPEQDRDGEFEVGEILRWRYHPRNGKIQYRTTWVGYSLYCAGEHRSHEEDRFAFSFGVFRMTY